MLVLLFKSLDLLNASSSSAIIFSKFSIIISLISLVKGEIRLQAKLCIVLIKKLLSKFTRSLISSQAAFVYVITASFLFSLVRGKRIFSFIFF